MLFWKVPQFIDKFLSALRSLSMQYFTSWCCLISMEFLTRNPSKHPRHVSLFARQKHADYVSWSFTRIKRRCHKRWKPSYSYSTQIPPRIWKLILSYLQWFCLVFTLDRWGKCASSSRGFLLSVEAPICRHASVSLSCGMSSSRSSRHNGLENLLLKKVVERNMYQRIFRPQKASFLFIKH